MMIQKQFVEFKIYISLKLDYLGDESILGLQNSKFTYLSNMMIMYISTVTGLQNSKFTYLSNIGRLVRDVDLVCRIQNLHISQTQVTNKTLLNVFVEFKIYISLKHSALITEFSKSLQNSKFTYLSNRDVIANEGYKVCRIQNLHISQTVFYVLFQYFQFVEFKIYISLKHLSLVVDTFIQFVEFKIYISLKLSSYSLSKSSSLQNSKFTYLSNRLVNII